MTMQIFNAQTANTTSDSYQLSNAVRTVFCWGTFGGATVTLQISPNGTDWFDVSDLQMTAESVKNVYLQPGTYVRGKTASGSGHSVSLVLV